MAKKTISNLNVVLTSTVAPFVKGFRGAIGATKSFATNVTSSIGGVAASVASMTGIGTAIGAAIGSIAAVGKGFSLAADFEQAQVAMETMLGSADGAKKLLGDLQSFAASTPFEFPELVDSSKKLVAFGVSADQILPTLRSIGDISAGVGVNVAELSEIYGKAKVQGRLFAEDVNQLVGRGIPVIQEFAKQFGVSEGEVKKLVEEGKIGFPQLQQAFIDLTKDGSKFGGMMSKQSGTLAGLFSTLKDTVGFTLMNIAQGIIDALNLKSVIGSVTTGMQSVGNAVVGFVKTYLPPFVNGLKAAYAVVAPVVMSVATVVWQAVQFVASALLGIGQRVYSALSPLFTFVAGIATAIYDFVSQNFTALLTNAIAVWNSIYAVVSTVVSLVWQVVSTVVGGVVTFLSWAWSAIFGSTSDGTSQSASVIQTLGKWYMWLQRAVATTFNVIAYTLNNFGAFFDYLATSIALGIVRTGNQIAYTFTEVIPALLSWFFNNWKDIFTTLWNFTTSVFTNMGKNIGNFFSAVWSALKGDGFDFQWTGLLEGFESTIKELPKIAERQIGPVEQALADAVQNHEFARGLGQFLNEQDKAAQNAAKGVTDAVAGAFDSATPEKPVEGIAKATEGVAIATMQVADSTTAVADAASKVKDEQKLADLVFANSAEALKARFMPSGGNDNGGALTTATNAARQAAGSASMPKPVDAHLSQQSGGSSAKLLDTVTKYLKEANEYLKTIADGQQEQTVFAEARF